METYKFTPSPNKTGYLNVTNPMGILVGELWEEAGIMIVMMYQNMVKQKRIAMANEMMYGYIMGMTHALMFAEHYPKFTLTKDGDVMTLRVVDPVLGEIWNGPPEQTPKASELAEDMLDRVIDPKKL